MLSCDPRALQRQVSILFPFHLQERKRCALAVRWLRVLYFLWRSCHAQRHVCSSCQLVQDVIVGKDCRLGDSGKEETRVSRSVIGDKCVIGGNCSLDTVYMLNDVVVGDNCVLEQCFLGEGVVLKDNVTVGKGCVIGDGVRICIRSLCPSWLLIYVRSFSDPTFVSKKASRSACFHRRSANTSRVCIVPNLTSKQEKDDDWSDEEDVLEAADEDGDTSSPAAHLFSSTARFRPKARWCRGCWRLVA